MSPPDRDISAAEFAAMGMEDVQVIEIIRRGKELTIESDEDDDTVLAMLKIAEAWMTSQYVVDAVKSDLEALDAWDEEDEEDDDE